MSTVRLRMHRSGTAYVLAIVLMVCFVAIAVGLAAFTNVNARTSKNVADIHRARLAAESGISFAIRQIRPLALPHATDLDNVIPKIAQELGERLDSTGNLAGGSVTHDGTTVYVPAITTDDGAFEIRVVQQADQTLSLEVQGLANDARRTVAVDLELKEGHPNSVLNYGIASRGPISVAGSGKVLGKNDLIEASIISSSDAAVAVSVVGDAVVHGDISSVGRETSVVISGSPTIAGSQDLEVIADHVHFAVDPPIFPEVDTSIFLPLATTVIDSQSDVSPMHTTFENIIIKAGTNPTFASDITINGVVYIEAPNIVNFSGKVTLNGVVATEPSSDPIETCKISFQAQVDAYGVEALPDLPQYAEVKELDGTFVIAPGFDVSFAGHFAGVNGTIAADKLTFGGQAKGTVKGAVIGLADHPTFVGGYVDIVIDRSGEENPGAGILPPKSLDVVPRTFREKVQ